MKNFCLITIVLFSFSASLFGYPGGVSGYTKKTGNNGCYCHTSSTTSSVIVSIKCPVSLQPSQIGDYTVTVSGGAGTAVGVDIAAVGGTLQTSDANLKTMNSELTHPSKRVFSGGQYVFKFKLTAPSITGKVTLYATACSKKSQWNFASNFDVAIESVTGINEANTTPASFQLSQNYPNPFNPTTTMAYQIPSEGLVTLNVYDILGNEITTLVNERKAKGSYTVVFDASNLANGMYLYQLKAEGYVSTKKMIFLK